MASDFWKVVCILNSWVLFCRLPLFLKSCTYNVAGDVRSPPPLLPPLLLCDCCAAAVVLVWCACGGVDSGGGAAVAFVVRTKLCLAHKRGMLS